MPFFESEYLLENSGVAGAVNSGIFSSGFAHYQEFGQFEQRPVAFTGSTGNDFLPELPVGLSGGEAELIGVPVTLDAQGNRIYQTGAGGLDTLVGGAATDIFVVGVSGEDFYNGFIGEEVRISNFDPNTDIIQLGKENNSFSTDYFFNTIPGNPNLTIQTRVGSLNDLFGPSIGVPLAVVENVVDPATGQSLLSDRNFRFAVQTTPTGEPLPLEVSFLEDEYLANNPDVTQAVSNGFFASGLEHYRNFGFNEGRATTFGGTGGSDIVAPIGGENNFVEITGVRANNLGDRAYRSDGTGEFDSLIGSPRTDKFILGTFINTRTLIPVTVPFYLGEGEARIVNFNQSEGDFIELFKNLEDNINVFPSGNDLVIEYQETLNDTIEVDTIAVIAGAANLNLTQNIERLSEILGPDKVTLF